MKQYSVFQKLFKGSKSIRFTANIMAAFRGKSQEMGEYPIVFDPQEENRTLIIGMFVLRPAYSAWTAPILSDDTNFLSKELYCVEDWAYGYNGIDGGSLVADSCPFDTFRVALQYGLSDAVIVGTKTVCAEGIDTITRKGYLWQPYYMTKLEQLKSACPNALELILEQRLELQVQGHLSSRQYPAVIISSNSGDYQGVTDFLDASIFSSFHPNGEPVECYILTCARGASRIRQRIFKSFPQLVDRMERMLIIVPNLIDSGNEVMTSMNIESVPKLLFDRLGIRIANHDGGQGVLRDYCRAGAIAQVNLTLCRNRSLKEVVSRYLLQDADTEDFDKRVKLFFSSSVATPPSKHRQMPRGTIPLNWTAICCVDDGGKNVAVVSFDTRAAGDFCHD